MWLFWSLLATADRVCSQLLPLAVGIPELALSTPAAAAGGAFVVDDSEIAKPGDCKVEFWVSFASNADFLGVTSPACVANLGRPVELGFSLARFRSGDEWGSEFLLKGKTNILPAGIGKIGLGLKRRSGFRSPDRGEFGKRHQRPGHIRDL